MEEKKTIKVSLGTVVCIFIIVLLVIALGIVYYLGFVKDKEELSPLKYPTENKEQKSNNTIDNSEEMLLSEKDIQNILDGVAFCIEDIEKNGNDYIITANILDDEERILTETEYNDLLNGKEISFRNQKWKLDKSEEDYIYIKSGNDILAVNKNRKTINNAAGVAVDLCDYSGLEVRFKVSKDILIGEYWTVFKYDKNGEIKAYELQDDDKEITNFTSISFERLKELSKGCKGTYDECDAYVKDGVIGAIHISYK